ncbi:uncharacterized protein LOC110913249 [Helianthus annuus]|uniref:uncharacterized protein LOC110913249 n=1 Tax=Helianthus annuus TaxID=4232 RepID=UPI000B8FDA63|nr:uncharacterized protein LOC110913249 [Helianthus annuus]
MSAYCQEVKTLSDQLENVGSPVIEEQLVIQLLTGLNEAYGSIATILQNQKPLPAFYEARSALCLKETTKANRVTNDSALHTSHVSHQALSSGPTGSGPTAPSGSNSSGLTGSGTHPTNQIGRGRGRGRGCGRGRGQHGGTYQQWAASSFGPAHSHGHHMGFG